MFLIAFQCHTDGARRAIFIFGSPFAKSESLTLGTGRLVVVVQQKSDSDLKGAAIQKHCAYSSADFFIIDDIGNRIIYLYYPWGISRHATLISLTTGNGDLISMLIGRCILILIFVTCLRTG